MPYIRVYLNDVQIEQIKFNNGQLIIGRDPNCDVVIDNAGVSLRHAVIEKNKDGVFVIRDKGSTNGVFVNGKKVDQQTLKYWDEIQIYNYILKFMAVSGLQESADPDLARDRTTGQSGTREVAMSDVQELLKLRKQKKSAYLDILNADYDQPRIFLKDVIFRIGRSKTCDLRTSGWFSPHVSAEIQRKVDGYYLVSRRRGQVFKNEQAAAASIKLADGDSLRVRNLSMSFFHRVAANK